MSEFAKLFIGVVALVAFCGVYVEFIRNQTEACIWPNSILRERACDKAVALGGQPAKLAALAHGARVQVKTIHAPTSLADARKAVELDPSNLDLQVLLLRSLWARNKLDEATGPLQTVLAARPEDTDALSTASYVCGGTAGASDIDDRLWACTAVIEQFKRTTGYRNDYYLIEALRHRMRMRYARDDLAAADSDAADLLRAKADNREALVMQGQVLLKRGHRDRAMTVFETAIRQERRGTDENDRKAIAAAQAGIAQALVPVTIRTGVLSQRRPRQAVAPLAVTASPSASVLIKVFEMGSQTPELVAFIRAGETLDAKMPIGTFEIKVAAGDTWYGNMRLFGPDTRYSLLASTFEFSATSRGYSGSRIELVTQRGGNLSQHSIDPSTF